MANASTFQDKPRGGPGLGFVIVVGMIAFVSGGIVTLAVTGPSKGTTAPTQRPVSAALPTQTTSTTPTDETTDPLKRRRPLTDFLSAEEVANFQQSLREGQTQGSIPRGAADGSSPSSAIPITSNPNIPNPEPWQYDPVADKHYDPSPGHQHWHRGRPPAQNADGSSPSSAVPITGTPNIPNPEPWQYDPATNKFWHPGHNHWHNGQPPPPDQRQ
ncbi:MAG: hypothetical protein ACYS15_07135 [Planctomycetota bacterium]